MPLVGVIRTRNPNEFGDKLQIVLSSTNQLKLVEEKEN